MSNINKNKSQEFLQNISKKRTTIKVLPMRNTYLLNIIKFYI